MKRWRLLVVALAIALLLPAVAKAEDWAIEEPDGTVYIWDGDQGIYRHVPDANTAFALGLTWCEYGDWCEVVHYDSVSDAGNCCGSDWGSGGGGGGDGCDGPTDQYVELRG